MTIAGKARSTMVFALMGLALTAAEARPQKHATAAAGPDDARRILVDKAHALETRGRPDMAVQLWQQILLSEPNNVEALAGLARDYKLTGANDQANEALERLRKADPTNANIGKIEALSSTRAQSDQLRQAGDLARQGKPDQAMRIYRSLYGDRPPDGDIALAFYQTLYGTANGKDQAVAGMRALAQRNPGDARFSVELAKMLTYQAKTRAEGIRILQNYPKDPTAQSALRQALVWDAANPASAAELRQYLKEHPQDSEIAGDLKEDQTKLSQMHSRDTRSPQEREAYVALNAKKLDEAQQLFTAILERDPKNGHAAAGMGFLRMRQNNFGGAISYLTQAEQDGFKDRTVEDALATSRFWFTMGEASEAADANRGEEAAGKYRDALTMRPNSPEALTGLAGLLTREKQYGQAAETYRQLLKIRPREAADWRGLFLAYAQDNQNQQALTVAAGMPDAVKTAMSSDPEYLRTLAGVYRTMGRNQDAERVLQQALTLPFPANGANLKLETRLEYAGILMEAHRYDQAADLYTLILHDDAGNVPAWMGLVSAQHEQKRDSLAINEVESMPPAVYEATVSDPGFLTMLGSIYQQANQPEIAQSLLERAAKLQLAGGREPSVELDLQLAALDMSRNNTAQAYTIYHKVLVAHPDRLDAWKGLIASLQSSGHGAAALQELAMIPPAVRQQLEADLEFNATESSLYSANGDYIRASQYMYRVQSHYNAQGVQAPGEIAIQNAWLLFNMKNDRALYPALMALGARQDLTVVERETVEDIWANWTVRRAQTATSDGNLQRAKDLLDAAFQAFPENLTVRKAVANGYLTAGRAREALAVFKSVPMQDAPPADYQGAVSAALAAGDLNQAESWLREALTRYASDAKILALAARFEQARGNNQRAADYWRASLAAMPAPTPTEKLAHELSVPEPQVGARRVNTPAELGRLLDPENEPYSRTAKLPPLPAYGVDPYSASAPVAAPVVIGAPAAQPMAEGPWQPASMRPAGPAAGSPVSSVIDPYSSGIQSGAQMRSSQALRGQSASAAPTLGNWQPSREVSPAAPVVVASAEPSSSYRASATRSGATRRPGGQVANHATPAPAGSAPSVAASVPSTPEGDVNAVLANLDAIAPPEPVSIPGQDILGSPIQEPIQQPIQQAVQARIQDREQIAAPVTVADLAPAPELARAAEVARVPELTPAPELDPVRPAASHSRGHKVKLSKRRSGSRNEPLMAASDLPLPPTVTVASPTAAPVFRVADAHVADAHVADAHVSDVERTADAGQGMGAGVRDLGNAPMSAPPLMSAMPESSAYASPAEPNASGSMLLAQYTPSAQEAASGAYSAPRQQQAQPVVQQPATATPAVPALQAETPRARTVHTVARRSRHHSRTHASAHSRNHGELMLADAPRTRTAPMRSAAQLTPSQPVTPYMLPVPASAYASSPLPPLVAAPDESAAVTPGITDAELQDRNLPPLRGSWLKVEREQRPLTPQDEAENQIQSIENGYSPWVGGAGLLNYRSGNLGYDHLSALESPFESSMQLGYTGRLTFVAKPVFLDSGQADGSATINVKESTTSGNILKAIPEPLGTDVNTGPTTSSTTATVFNIPAQQNSAGIGGEVQLAFDNFAVAGGYSPSGFLVANATARMNWRPANGPFTVSFNRDSIKDSQLSYSGLRDPGTTTLAHQGQIWGGVVANQGNVQYSRGDASSGYYFGAGGQYIAGTNVVSNSRIDFSGGSYWHVLSNPERGDLSVGTNFFAMHYANNQLAYTYGLGGYFSPQAYFLANVPFTWNGHAGPRWHYNILGSFGVQAFQEDATPLWPFAADKFLEANNSNASLPEKTSVGPNYDFRAQTAYAITPNWFAGGFLGANNARDYTSASVGFYIRYLFKPQVNAVSGPTGMFPSEGMRPFRVP